VDDIHSTFDELQKTLNVRKSVLLMELEVNYGLKHKVRLCSPAGFLGGGGVGVTALPAPAYCVLTVAVAGMDLHHCTSWGPTVPFTFSRYSTKLGFRELSVATYSSP
jgi:hypothetical protein